MDSSLGCYLKYAPLLLNFGGFQIVYGVSAVFFFFCRYNKEDDKNSIILSLTLHIPITAESWLCADAVQF